MFAVFPKGRSQPVVVYAVEKVGPGIPSTLFLVYEDRLGWQWISATKCYPCTAANKKALQLSPRSV